MNDTLRLWPQSASSLAPAYDAMFIAVTVMTAILTLGIAATILYFVIRYRRRDPDETGADTRRASASKSPGR